MQKLDEMWTEEELIKKFGLPEKDGRSSHVARWVSKGLVCVELVGKRFFREEDIVAFFNERTKESKE